MRDGGVEFFQGSAALFVGQAVQVVQFSAGLLFRLPRRLPFLDSLRGSRGGWWFGPDHWQGAQGTEKGARTFSLGMVKISKKSSEIIISKCIKN